MPEKNDARRFSIIKNVAIVQTRKIQFHVSGATENGQKIHAFKHTTGQKKNIEKMKFQALKYIYPAVKKMY